MLGLVLLSEYNELVHAFGNPAFRAHFGASARAPMSASSAQGTSSSSTRPTSSSSGVSSTSAASSSAFQRKAPVTAKRKGKKAGKTEAKEGEMEEEEDDFYHGHRLDEALLVQQLMPLVLLCRAKTQQQQGDGQHLKGKKGKGTVVERIESTGPAGSAPFCIRMANLPHSNLLALFHGTEESTSASSSSSSPHPSSSSSSIDHLFSALLRCVLYHYGGPALQLIPLQSPFVQQLRERCEHRMMRILNKNSKGKGGEPENEEAEEGGEEEEDDDDDAPFCQNLSFASPSRLVQQTLLPQFKELAQRIADRIGRRCRCLFLHSGHLLATVSSHGGGEPTLAALRAGDLRSLLRFARQRPPPQNPATVADDNGERGGPMKCHAELGVWLYSRSMRRRQLHHVFVVSLSDRIELVCVATAERSQLISTIWEALEGVEKLGDYSQQSAAQIQLDKCERQLANGQKMLAKVGKTGRNEQKQQREQPGALFLMENIPRTQKLIQHHWSRLRSSINTYCAQQQASDHRIPSGSSSSRSSGPRPSSSSIIRPSPPHIHPHPSSHPPLHHPLPCPSFLSRLHLCSSPSPTPSGLLHQLTITSSSLGFPSASSVSASSALPSSVCSSSRLSTAHLDAMRAQLKKVLRGLLDELLSLNAATCRSHCLPQVLSALHQSMVPSLARPLALLDAEIGQKLRGPGDSSPLRPAHFGLDMIAFHFARFAGGGGGIALHFHYAPESLGQDMRRMLSGTLMTATETEGADEEGEAEEDEEEGRNKEEGEGEEIAFARTADGELLIQIQTGVVATPPSSSSSSSVATTPSATVARGGLLAAVSALPLAAARLGSLLAAPSPATVSRGALCRCTVLFSRHTNTSLAVRQTGIMMAALNAQMERNIVPNFQ